MATKTFSSRVEAKDLEYVEAVIQHEFGMSFGQYCGSILVEAIKRGDPLPSQGGNGNNDKIDARKKMKMLSQKKSDPVIAHMTDAEIKDLIAGRYA